MRRFSYKLSPIILTLIIIGLVLCIFAIIFSALKLFDLPNLKSISPIFDIITIIISFLFIFILILTLTLHYKVNTNGIKLVFGFIPINNGFNANEISAVVYKTKQNLLLIVKDLTSETVFGSAINISSDKFNAFIKALTDCKISFDYIEDSD